MSFLATRELICPFATLFKPDARIPSTDGKKGLGIVHLQDFAKGPLFVRSVLIVRFDDPISDPVTKVARSLHCRIVKPLRKIGLVLVINEARFDLLLMTFGRGAELGVGD